MDASSRSGMGFVLMLLDLYLLCFQSGVEEAGCQCVVPKAGMLPRELSMTCTALFMELVIALLLLPLLLSPLPVLTPLWVLFGMSVIAVRCAKKLLHAMFLRAFDHLPSLRYVFINIASLADCVPAMVLAECFCELSFVHVDQCF